ncbi:hypothetical protein BDF20DRAFT_860147 [Mycotypha africana]|uniref:uncharacterized protein n=1 Tax=Mycotypha africana TaxID=64632 RepID=UPI00230108B1|nr:uncharacterized protein BDF20DRAFT_860147 [Mycotypha africana]KAI8984468.1 hypothetical protein BDF20DRAFT_860147 [Mycotypha africana]
MANYFKILNSAYVGIGSFIFFRQVDKAFHLSNYVRELRVLYFISQLIIFGINLLIIRKIRQINGKVYLCSLIIICTYYHKGS